MEEEEEEVVEKNGAEEEDEEEEEEEEEKEEEVAGEEKEEGADMKEGEGARGEWGGTRVRTEGVEYSRFSGNRVKGLM